MIRPVNSAPKHFQPADVPLLCVYAEAVVQARACAKLLCEGTGSDLTIKAQRNALSAVFQLSMRLRVSPQARQVRKSLGSDTCAERQLLRSSFDGDGRRRWSR